MPDVPNIDPKKKYVLSGKTLKKLFAAANMKGVKDQLTVRDNPDGTRTIGFANWRQIYIIHNGAPAAVYVPMWEAPGI